MQSPSRKSFYRHVSQFLCFLILVETSGAGFAYGWVPSESKLQRARAVSEAWSSVVDPLLDGLTAAWQAASSAAEAQERPAASLASPRPTTPPTLPQLTPEQRRTPLPSISSISSILWRQGAHAP